MVDCAGCCLVVVWCVFVVVVWLVMSVLLWLVLPVVPSVALCCCVLLLLVLFVELDCSWLCGRVRLLVFVDRALFGCVWCVWGVVRLCLVVFRFDWPCLVLLGDVWV